MVGEQDQCPAQAFHDHAVRQAVRRDPGCAKVIAPDGDELVLADELPHLAGAYAQLLGDLRKRQPRVDEGV